jgi:hypothetical protein
MGNAIVGTASLVIAPLLPILWLQDTMCESTRRVFRKLPVRLLGRSRPGVSLYDSIKRSLNTREWGAAAAIVHGWEASGQVGVVKADVPTVVRAVELYFDDAKARHLAATTVRKRRELLEGKLLRFCKAKGVSLLKQLDVGLLRSFRNGWPYSALSTVKRLEYLRSFLRFCQDSGWIESNPAMVLKPPRCRSGQRSRSRMARSIEFSKPLTNSRTGDRSGRRLAPWCCSFGTPVCECRTRRVSNEVGSKRQAVHVHAKDRHPRVLSAPPDCGRSVEKRLECAS